MKTASRRKRYRNGRNIAGRAGMDKETSAGEALVCVLASAWCHFSSFAALVGVFRDDDISIYEISMEVYSIVSSIESPTILR